MNLENAIHNFAYYIMECMLSNLFNNWIWWHCTRKAEVIWISRGNSLLNRNTLRAIRQQDDCVSTRKVFLPFVRFQTSTVCQKHLWVCIIRQVGNLKERKSCLVLPVVIVVHCSTNQHEVSNVFNCKYYWCSW